MRKSKIPLNDRSLASRSMKFHRVSQRSAIHSVSPGDMVGCAAPIHPIMIAWNGVFHQYGKMSHEADGKMGKYGSERAS